MLRYLSNQAQLVKSYYAGLGKTGVIYPTAFFMAVALGTFGFGLTYYAKDFLHCTDTTVGWLAATWAGSYVLGCLFVRPLFDRVPPRHLIAGALFCIFGFTVGIRLAGSVIWVFVLQGLYGLAVSHFWPPLMGWLSTDFEGGQLNRVVSRFNISWCTGSVVSPYLGGWLCVVWGVHGAMMVAAGIFLVTAFFAAGAALALAGTPGATAVESPDAAPLGRSTLLRYPAWLGLFPTFFGMNVLAVIFLLVGTADLGFSRLLVGALLFFRGLWNAVAFFLLGRTVFWHFRVWPILLAQLLMAMAFIGMAYATTPLAIGILMAVLGVTLAMSYAASLFHGVSGSAHRAGRMAVHESVLAAGLVAGSGLGGMVYQAHGRVVLFWVCALVVLAGVALQTPLCLWVRRHEGPAGRRTGAAP